MKYCLFALTLIVATSTAASTAFAGAISAPSELNPGDQFRIVFVTDGTTNATDNTFTTYDNLVQSAASGTTYNGNSITWKAIVGTSTVSAIDHIGESTTSSIPIFLVDGTKVTASDNTSGLWSGTLLHSISEDLLGAAPTGPGVWTGAFYTGAISGGSVGNSGASVAHGQSTETSLHWSNAPGIVLKTALLHVYGISEVLTVPQATAAVPEPSTAMLAGLGGLVALAYSFKRKRN